MYAGYKLQLQRIKLSPGGNVLQRCADIIPTQNKHLRAIISLFNTSQAQLFGSQAISAPALYKSSCDDGIQIDFDVVWHTQHEPGNVSILVQITMADLAGDKCLRNEHCVCWAEIKLSEVWCTGCCFKDTDHQADPMIPRTVYPAFHAGPRNPAELLVSIEQST